MSHAPSVLVVAAEESSCKYAVRVMRGLKHELGHDVRFWGVGNLEMRNQGFKALAHSEDMAVMGLFEIFKIQALIRQALKNILEEVDKNPPKVALLLDYGGFNLHLAQALKARNIPVVYYVLPKVWAWRKKRALKIKAYVDHALAIHPFEEKFFADLGVKATFVGHPLLEEKQDFLNKKFDVQELKRSLNMKEGPVLGLMPGSRNSEVSRHFNLMLEAAQKIKKVHADLQVVVLLAPAFTPEGLKNQISAQCDLPLHFIKRDSWDMIGLCDFLITASGTATLQVGLLQKPQVVVYKMNPLSARLARIVVKIPFFSLINLILNKNAVTELFQGDANPEAISQEVLELMKKTERYTQLLGDYSHLEAEMQKTSATTEVVKILKQYLSQKNQDVQV